MLLLISAEAVSMEPPQRSEQEILAHRIFDVSLSMTPQQAIDTLVANGYEPVGKAAPGRQQQSWQYVKDGTQILFSTSRNGDGLGMITITENTQADPFDVARRAVSIAESWGERGPAGDEKVAPICSTRPAARIPAGQCLVNSSESNATGYFATLFVNQIMQRLLRFEP